MLSFVDVLARLKEAAKVKRDHEAAELLGLSGAALHARKKRNAFPERELYALVAKRPDLRIDVGYVLTGKPTPPEEAAQHALLIQHSEGLVAPEVMTKGLRDAAADRDAAAKSRSNAWQELLLSCSESDQDLLLHIASRLSRIPQK